MNPNINDISQRLQNAINIHYDVVDMDAVMAVIKLLEGTKITKEQLETTRLAKHINQLRKRTQNDLLARRAKSLLKRWREMLGINDSAVGSASASMLDPHISIVDSSSQMGCSQSSVSKPVAAEAVKPKKNIDAPQGPKASRSTVSMDAAKPPTTFCNLITGMSGSNYQQFESKSSHRGRQNYQARDDGDAISNVSNLNSDIRYNPATETAPIVIDIPDSSSGSNLMISPAPTVAEPIAMLSSSSEIFGTQFKHKKNKKDKKRKEERNRAATSTSQFFKQQADTGPDSKRGVPASVDETSFNNPNISEILTLSNSSMSSIFPNEDALKSFNQNILDRSVVPPRSISTNELSFAGKFAKSYSHSSGAANTLNDTSSSGVPPLRSDTSFATDSRKKTRKPPAPSVSANNSNVNSNDSVLSVPVVLPHDPLPTNQNQQLSALDEGNSRLQNASQTDNRPVGPDTFDNHEANPEKKVPKKRGRKKGSKGVDSVIAKETSLSSQMLMTSLGGGGKKVKTTKELYAEMQNRKLGVIATSSPTLFSRPPSSCSEPSGQSPRTSDGFSSTMLRNETPSVHDENKSNGIGDDDSDTATSEPSGDSVSIQKAKTWCAPATNSLKNAESLESASIHCQLLELVKDLPPPPDLRDIEMEFLKDAYPCSCQITETLPQSVEEGKEEPPAAVPEDAVNANSLENSENSNRESTNPVKVEEVNNSLGRNKAPASPPAKPKKSIFDLDFDQDEDPLLTFLTEAKATVKEEPPEKPQDNVEAQSVEVGKSATEAAEDTSSRVLVKEEEINPWQDWPIYTIEEDAECVAKERFNVQTQKVTNFHIKSLHNFYIPNINGNWDDKYQADNATADKDSKDIAKPLLENVCVVPSYDSYIRKDLRHINLLDKGSLQRAATKEPGVYDDSPFLGVSRYREASDQSPDGNRGSDAQSAENAVDCSAIKTEVSEYMSTAEEADAPEDTKVKVECISPDDETTASGMAVSRVPGVGEVSRSMDDIVQSPLVSNESNGDSSRRMKRRKRKRKKYLKELKCSDSGKMKRSKRTMDSDGEQNELSYGYDAEESTMDNESTFSGDEPAEGAPNGLDEGAPDGDNKFRDYHEVVTRDVSVPFSGSNRIVLTIKKTNKTQSSAASIASAAPKQETSPPHQAPSAPAALPESQEAQESAAEAPRGSELRSSNSTPGEPERDIGEKLADSSAPIIPLEAAASEKSWLEAKSAAPKQKKFKCRRPSRSLRDELFFDNEIEALLKGDETDSSCDGFTYGYDGGIPPEKEAMDEEGEPSAQGIVPKEEPAASPSDGDELTEDREAEALSWHVDSADGDVKDRLDDTKLKDSGAPVAPTELADGNNGLIVSFNSIHEEAEVAIESGHGHTHAAAEDIGAAPGTDDGFAASAQLNEMLPNKNCDDFNKTVFLNNNNFHLSKYSSKPPSIGYRDVCEDVCSQQEVARIASKTELHGDQLAAAPKREEREYVTGQRAVDEDLQDEMGNNCSRIQKFKEWHQVLQLRSYNDELLTVLPYVVLE